MHNFYGHVGLSDEQLNPLRKCIMSFVNSSCDHDNPKPFGFWFSSLCPTVTESLPLMHFLPNSHPLVSRAFPISFPHNFMGLTIKDKYHQLYFSLTILLHFIIVCNALSCNGVKLTKWFGLEEQG